MAHFAEIDENNIVLRVLVIPNDVEAEGAEWCAARFGGRWVQTSYNANIRRRFAGQGDRYDEALDAFIESQPYPSWTLDQDGYWQPPIPSPGDNYYWDEAQQTWLEIVPPGG